MSVSTPSVSRTRQVVAAVVGNALEWYDFIVYGFLASFIARQFFPAEDEYTSLLMALATFGVGFFMRPVGGVLLGIYSDRRGRKAAMLVIIQLMTLAIAMIVFAPNYAAIGIGAPLLIVVARMLQALPPVVSTPAPRPTWWRVRRPTARAFTAPGSWWGSAWRYSAGRRWWRR